jgi:putative metallohydrolase (TIGR04338 family)
MVVKNQQQLVYDAERVLGHMRRFKDVAEVEEFVNGLRDTWWWQRFFWRVPYIEVETTHMQINGLAYWNVHKNAGLIELNPKMPNGLTLVTTVHEMAHIFADAIFNSTAHDPEYCRTYLWLVNLIIGADEYLKLQDAFKKRGVEVALPGKSRAIAL